MRNLIITLCIVYSAIAEQPGFNPQYNDFQRSISGPYQPSGWRPSGPAFNPTRFEQQQPQSQPQQEYGAPQQQQRQQLNNFPARIQQQQQQNVDFNFPAKNQQLPEYAPPPPQTYGVPSGEYGPPAYTTTQQPETTTEPITTTQTPEFGNLKDAEDLEDKNGKLANGDDASAVTQQGVYYIYHPTGLLQKVVYATKDDSTNMAYTARLKYQNVEPIKEPIYTYDPQTLSFRQIQA